MSAVRLTSHQAEVFGRLKRRSGIHGRHDGDGRLIEWGWVHEDEIGCHGGLSRLVLKGYAERREVRGPRGGYSYDYRVIGDGG